MKKNISPNNSLRENEDSEHSRQITKEFGPPKAAVIGFFLVGLIASIAIRVIAVIQHINPALVRPFWYIGVLGFITFFSYQYAISRRRTKMIKDHQLIEKLKTNACLLPEDRHVALHLLSSMDKSLERFNFAAIFILSIVAIGLDIFLSVR
jgi:hypothetical protein